jgi:hypothetical protein
MVSSSSFRPPERIVPSAWHEHAPFAFWLVEQLRPNLLVELGTYYGFSFFAFCQAIRMAGLSTAAFAVDLWTGDEHAGFYGEEVYQSVESYCREHYSDIATLMRMSFADALQYFEDGSIDLLHIDGRHYEQDVRSDFENWLPKLSDRAVVLLHDVNVREREFGVHRVWSDLCNTYPSFSFNHGHGLGVLAVGRPVSAAIADLFNSSADEALTSSVRTAYARLGGAVVRTASDDLVRQRDTLSVALEAEKAAAAQSSEQAAAFGREAEALRAAVQEREAAAATLRAAAQDREAAAARAAEQLAATQADLRAREGEVGRLSRELEAARLYLRDSQAEVQRLAGECDSAQADAAHAAAEHQSLSEALAAAAAERDRLAAALEEEKAALAQANEQAAALNRETGGLRGVIREYEATATEFLSDLEAMQALARERESERDQLAAALEKARLEAEWRGERLCDLSRELRAAAVEAERAGHLEAIFAALQQDNARRERLVIELSQKLEAESGERRRIAAELARAYEQIRHVEDGAADRATVREAIHTAELADSEQKALEQIRELKEQLVDAEAALAKERRESDAPTWKRIISRSKARRLGHKLIQTGLFDAAWYVRKYPETAENGRTPVEHYLEEGYLRGYRPNPLFDSRWYLQHYDDVRHAGINPLVHYLQNGYREGRNPGPGFETDFYLLTYPDVRKNGINPLAHYLRYGQNEGRLPKKQ